jgi:hypothetical protein
MTALNRTPSNTNFLQPSKFILAFNRLPTVQYFCQSANLPGVSLGQAQYSTPLLDVPVAGNKLEYNEFNIQFYIDEDIASWNELYKWFLAIASPKSFADRNTTNSLQNQYTTKASYYSDSNLTIMSALNNPVARIDFHKMFPVSLSDIQFDTTQSADTIITATAIFRYDFFEITNL